jgi:hypothetical protein
MLLSSGATFDPALLNVAGAKLTHSGGTGINLSYGPDKQPIVFRTPFMLSFGINTWHGTTPPHHTVTLSFYGQPADDPFHQALNAMDEWLLHTAAQHTWEWLKSKTLPLERLQEQHFRTLRASGGGMPHIKFNLKTTAATNSFSTLFFTTPKTPQPLTAAVGDINRHFVKGTLAAGLLQCTGIWVKDGRFGFSWKLVQLMLIPPLLPLLPLLPPVASADNTCMIED